MAEENPNPETNIELKTHKTQVDVVPEENQILETNIGLKTHKPAADANKPEERIQQPPEILHDDEKSCSERVSLCNRHNIFANFFIKVFYCFFGVVWNFLLLLFYTFIADYFECFIRCLCLKKCQKHINEDIYEGLDVIEVYRDSVDLDPRTSFSSNYIFNMRYQISKIYFCFIYLLRSFIRIPQYACCSSRRKADEYESKINAALESNDKQTLEKLKAGKIKEGGFINNSCKEICDYFFRDPKKLFINTPDADVSQTNPIYYIKNNFNNDLSVDPTKKGYVEVRGMNQN